MSDKSRKPGRLNKTESESKKERKTRQKEQDESSTRLSSNIKKGTGKKIKRPFFPYVPCAGHRGSEFRDRLYKATHLEAQPDDSQPKRYESQSFNLREHPYLKEFYKSQPPPVHYTSAVDNAVWQASINRPPREKIQLGIHFASKYFVGREKARFVKKIECCNLKKEDRAAGNNAKDANKEPQTPANEKTILDPVCCNCQNLSWSRFAACPCEGQSPCKTLSPGFEDELQTSSQDIAVHSSKQHLNVTMTKLDRIKAKLQNMEQFGRSFDSDASYDTEDNPDEDIRSCDTCIDDLDLLECSYKENIRKSEARLIRLTQDTGLVSDMVAEAIEHISRKEYGNLLENQKGQYNFFINLKNKKKKKLKDEVFKDLESKGFNQAEYVLDNVEDGLVSMMSLISADLENLDQLTPYRHDLQTPTPKTQTSEIPVHESKQLLNVTMTKFERIKAKLQNLKLFGQSVYSDATYASFASYDPDNNIDYNPDEDIRSCDSCKDDLDFLECSHEENRRKSKARLIQLTQDPKLSSELVSEAMEHMSRKESGIFLVHPKSRFNFFINLKNKKKKKLKEEVFKDLETKGFNPEEYILDNEEEGLVSVMSLISADLENLGRMTADDLQTSTPQTPTPEISVNPSKQHLNVTMTKFERIKAKLQNLKQFGQSIDSSTTYSSFDPDNDIEDNPDEDIRSCDSCQDDLDLLECSFGENRRVSEARLIRLTKDSETNSEKLFSEAIEHISKKESGKSLESQKGRFNFFKNLKDKKKQKTKDAVFEDLKKKGIKGFNPVDYVLDDEKDNLVSVMSVVSSDLDNLDWSGSDHISQGSHASVSLPQRISGSADQRMAKWRAVELSKQLGSDYVDHAAFHQDRKDHAYKHHTDNYGKFEGNRKSALRNLKLEGNVKSALRNRDSTRNGDSIKTSYSKRGSQKLKIDDEAEVIVIDRNENRNEIDDELRFQLGASLNATTRRT